MKRIILIASIVLITISCYIFMNRNYDPLARYSYDDSKAKEIIIKYLDEREIKYIVDYQIDPNEFIKYASANRFSAYHFEQYNEAYKYLTNLTPDQIVEVVERLNKKDIDFNYAMNVLMNKEYEDILFIIDRGL